MHDSVRQRAGVLRGNGQPTSAPVTRTGPSKAPVPQPHPEDPSFWKAPVGQDLRVSGTDELGTKQLPWALTGRRSGPGPVLHAAAAGL